MITRFASGLVAATLLILLIYRGAELIIISVVLILAVASSFEVDLLFFEKRSLFRILRVGGFIVAAILALRSGLEQGLIVVLLAFAVLGVHGVASADRSGKFREELVKVALEWLGVFYSVGLFGFVLPIYNFADSGQDWLLLLFLVVFGGDTAAYFVGKSIGKNSLARKISPKKTLEGALGGVSGSCLAAWIWANFVHPVSLSMYLWVLVILTSILAQAGDLFESLMKRSCHQKDSGTFLPGHGGILDRVDGLVFATPFFYCFLKALGGTNVS